jgi:Flp pilus assembly protein TadG
MAERSQTRTSVPHVNIARRRRERAQSLAELALLLPVLLAVMIVAVDIGRLYFAYVAVTNGARNGASYAALSATNAANTSGIEDAVLQDTTSLSSDPSVSSTTGTDLDGNMYTRVTVEHAFDPLFEIPGFPLNITLRRSVQMRVSP